MNVQDFSSGIRELYIKFFFNELLPADYVRRHQALVVQRCASLLLEGDELHNYLDYLDTIMRAVNPEPPSELPKSFLTATTDWLFGTLSSATYLEEIRKTISFERRAKTSFCIGVIARDGGSQVRFHEAIPKGREITDTPMPPIKVRASEMGQRKARIPVHRDSLEGEELFSLEFPLPKDLRPDEDLFLYLHFPSEPNLLEVCLRYGARQDQDSKATFSVWRLWEHGFLPAIDLRVIRHLIQGILEEIQKQPYSTAGAHEGEDRLEVYEHLGELVETALKKEKVAAEQKFNEVVGKLENAGRRIQAFFAYQALQRLLPQLDNGRATITKQEADYWWNELIDPKKDISGDDAARNLLAIVDSLVDPLLPTPTDDKYPKIKKYLSVSDDFVASLPIRHMENRTLASVIESYTKTYASSVDGSVEAELTKYIEDLRRESGRPDVEAGLVRFAQIEGPRLQGFLAFNWMLAQRELSEGELDAEKIGRQLLRDLSESLSHRDTRNALRLTRQLSALAAGQQATLHTLLHKRAEIPGKEALEGPKAAGYAVRLEPSSQIAAELRQVLSSPLSDSIHPLVRKRLIWETDEMEQYRKTYQYTRKYFDGLLSGFVPELSKREQLLVLIESEGSYRNLLQVAD